MRSVTKGLRRLLLFVQNLMLAWSDGIGTKRKWSTGDVTRQSEFSDASRLTPNPNESSGLSGMGIPRWFPNRHVSRCDVSCQSPLNR